MPTNAFFNKLMSFPTLKEHSLTFLYAKYLHRFAGRLRTHRFPIPYSFLFTM